MTEAGGRDALWIVGAGRLGLALGTALHRAGAARALAFSGRRASAPDHLPLFAGPGAIASYAAGLVPPSWRPTGVVVAVPDGAVADVASRLARLDHLPTDIPILHTSGVLGADALAPLAARGHPTGSLHPLAAIADPATGAERLRGAWFGVEGDGAALELAERIVAACGGFVLRVEPGGKPLYHAAAVFASNYAVALLAVAERLMARAGVPAEEARPALAALAAGAVANVEERGPAPALTGPVARGDAETVRLHLARLSGRERPLYSLLAREALALAESAGLDPAAAGRLREVLEGEGGRSE